MLLLDTNIWVWWVTGDTAAIPAAERLQLTSEPSLAVSAMSCLEVALLVQRGRIALEIPLTEWFELALAGSGHLVAAVAAHRRTGGWPS